MTESLSELHLHDSFLSSWTSAMPTKDDGLLVHTVVDVYKRDEATSKVDLFLLVEQMEQSTRVQNVDLSNEVLQPEGSGARDRVGLRAEREGEYVVSKELDWRR